MNVSPVSSKSDTSAAAVPSVLSRLRGLAGGLPALVTLGLHAVLLVVAAAVVVQTQIIAPKKTFEAAPAGEPEVVRQVEHRVQVARRGGASGAAASPVAASRIFSTAADAVRLPEPADLPDLGAGGFGGFGGMGAGLGAGAGSGLSTSLGGGAGLGGRGFMSLSFLGAAAPNVSNVVFVVDTSTEIMAPRKGGFEAFGIIREEILRLVGRLPPAARFNVILYRAGGRGSEDDEAGLETNLFRAGLVPATSENKKDFFAWMSPVNAQLDRYGPGSAARRLPWERKPLPAGTEVDALLLPPVWGRAVHAALEQQPDVVYLITASAGAVRRRVDEGALEGRRTANERERAKFEAEMAREGLDPEAVIRAREASLAKARRELAEANRRLVAEGKTPVVVTDTQRIFTSEVQAELRKRGVRIERETTGWTRKDGSLITPPGGNLSTVTNASWEDFATHLARLQRALCPERARLNIFLFTGPEDRAAAASQTLSDLAKRHGGTFQLLNAERLRALRSKDEGGK